MQPAFDQRCLTIRIPFLPGPTGNTESAWRGSWRVVFPSLPQVEPRRGFESAAEPVLILVARSRS
jgi:hypothetical protein